MENILDIIYVPLGWIIRICYELLPSYVFALLLFAVIIKVLMIPLSVRQHKNSLKQASLRPREAAIIKKYKGSNDKSRRRYSCCIRRKTTVSLPDACRCLSSSRWWFVYII